MVKIVFSVKFHVIWYLSIKSFSSSNC